MPLENFHRIVQGALPSRLDGTKDCPSGSSDKTRSCMNPKKNKGVVYFFPSFLGRLMCRLLSDKSSKEDTLLSTTENPPFFLH
ncbi:hypothetical protein EUGRSUZ_J02885 [Eucalyptus grandis]|uniref:Uncharacterized protein n=2 Tax=Eucalyptus grandis TaxID=71139 RepID=A0ACC3JA01_EUCGR|nr:hypothetical protein EUGRSUZ_J02885 [Eucalyptus grandis]